MFKISEGHECACWLYDSTDHAGQSMEEAEADALASLRAKETAGSDIGAERK
jgi:hypothetical protein